MCFSLVFFWLNKYAIQKALVFAVTLTQLENFNISEYHCVCVRVSLYVKLSLCIMKESLALLLFIFHSKAK